MEEQEKLKKKETKSSNKTKQSNKVEKKATRTRKKVDETVTCKTADWVNIGSATF